MPMYAYTCPSCGDPFDRLVPIAARDDQACSCGSSATRHLTAVALTGQATPLTRTPDVPLRRRLPSSWQGVGASREGIAHYQRIEERLTRLEDRHPELADHRMPVVAHEGGRIVHATEKSTPGSSPRTPRV